VAQRSLPYGQDTYIWNGESVSVVPVLSKVWTKTTFGWDHPYRRKRSVEKNHQRGVAGLLERLKAYRPALVVLKASGRLESVAAI
jgi:hypothetical protein